MTYDREQRKQPVSPGISRVPERIFSCAIFSYTTLAQIMTKVFICQNKIILSKKNTIILPFDEKDLHFVSLETACEVKYLPR